MNDFEKFASIFNCVENVCDNAIYQTISINNFVNIFIKPSGVFKGTNGIKTEIGDVISISFFDTINLKVFEFTIYDIKFSYTAFEDCKISFKMDVYENGDLKNQKNEEFEDKLTQLGGNKPIIKFFKHFLTLIIAEQIFNEYNLGEIDINVISNLLINNDGKTNYENLKKVFEILFIPKNRNDKQLMKVSL